MPRSRLTGSSFFPRADQNIRRASLSDHIPSLTAVCSTATEAAPPPSTRRGSSVTPARGPRTSRFVLQTDCLPLLFLTHAIQYLLTSHCCGFTLRATRHYATSAPTEVATLPHRLGHPVAYYAAASFLYQPSCILHGIWESTSACPYAAQFSSVRGG